MSTTENAGNSKKCSSQGLVFVLLLFIGFVTGLVTGFTTKDVVMQHLERTMHAAIAKDKDDVKPIPAVSKSAAPGVTEVHPSIVVPAPDDKKKEEEKKAETKPADEAKPAGETKPADEVKPTGETKPADETKPAGETKPADETKPAGEAKPADETKPAE